MLTIPESVKALYKTDGVRKNFRAHFPGGEMADITNANIVRESLHFTESLCSQNNFRFGLAEASVLEFETVGVENMYGMTIQASIEIDVSSLTAAQIADIQAGTWDGELVDVSESDIGYGYYRIPLGVFRVEKCPRNHGAMTHRKVVAYSADQIQEDPNGTIPGLFTELPTFQNYKPDVAGVIAAGTGNGLTKIGNVDFGTTVNPTGYLFDSAGTRYMITVYGRVDSQSYTAALARYAVVYGTYSGDAKSDFIKAANFDATDYYAQGEAILSAIDSAGIDFTYDANRKKIFSSNREALSAIMPYLLCPSISTISVENQIQMGPTPITDVRPKTLHGVLSTDDQRLFTVPASFLSSRLYWMDYSAIGASYQDTTGIFLRWTWQTSGTSHSDGVYVDCLTRQAPPVVEMFQGTVTGMRMQVDNSGKLPDAFSQTLSQSSGVFTFQKVRKFSYANTVDYPKLFNGCYELKSQFAKTDRLGGFETVELSPASYLSIGPGDCEDVWWDEYDVDPIGSVVVTSKGTDGRNTPATVTIGNGASVYDMSDNEAMEKLTANTISDIRTLLRGSFKTNAARVGFTPIEMTMQGWPWLEAGDALRITAEDGTVVNTYALRVEMDGVQHLMATITAEGGEIVGET